MTMDEIEKLATKLEHHAQADVRTGRSPEDRHPARIAARAALLRAVEGIVRERDRAESALAAMRPEVLAFARVMSAKIDGHNHDRGEYGWRTATPARLMEWLEGYVTALSYALDASTMDAVLGKAANVANLAMMIADACGALASPPPAALSTETEVTP